MTHHLVLQGHIPTKKNSKNAWRGRVVINPQIKRLVEGLEWQALELWRGRPKLDRVRLRALFHIRDRRGDLDGKLTTLLDVLKVAGVIRDDNAKRVVGFEVSHEVATPEKVEVELVEA